MIIFGFEEEGPSVLVLTDLTWYGIMELLTVFTISMNFVLIFFLVLFGVALFMGGYFVGMWLFMREFEQKEPFDTNTRDEFDTPQILKVKNSHERKD